MKFAVPVTILMCLWAVEAYPTLAKIGSLAGGLTNKVPDVSSLVPSDLPDVSNLVPCDLPNVPAGLPNLPTGVPNVPGVDGLPNLPTGVPNVPGGLSNVPGGLSNVPGGLSNVPGGLSNVPCDLPNVPGADGLSNLPDLPGVPADLPGAPAGLPGVPGGLSNVPGTDGLNLSGSSDSTAKGGATAIGDNAKVDVTTIATPDAAITNVKATAGKGGQVAATGLSEVQSNVPNASGVDGPDNVPCADDMNLPAGSDSTAKGGATATGENAKVDVTTIVTKDAAFTFTDADAGEGGQAAATGLSEVQEYY